MKRNNRLNNWHNAAIITAAVINFVWIGMVFPEPWIYATLSLMVAVYLFGLGSLIGGFFVKDEQGRQPLSMPQAMIVFIFLFLLGLLALTLTWFPLAATGLLAGACGVDFYRRKKNFPARRIKVWHLISLPSAVAVGLFNGFLSVDVESFLEPNQWWLAYLIGTIILELLLVVGAFVARRNEEIVSLDFVSLWMLALFSVFSFSLLHTIAAGMFAFAINMLMYRLEGLFVNKVVDLNRA